MSLLNAWIAPGEALVAVDTDGTRPDGERFSTSKMLALPHLSAVIALRGQAAFFHLLFLRALHFQSFDQLAREMPGIIAETEAAIPDELIVSGVVGQGHELMLVGYSPMLERMVGLQFIRRDGKRERREVDKHVSPWHRELAGTSIEPQDLEALAAAQVRWMRQTFENAACGGSLLVCRITRGAFVMNHTMEFEPQEA